jgi:hypothetical protein
MPSDGNRTLDHPWRDYVADLLHGCGTNPGGAAEGRGFWTGRQTDRCTHLQPSSADIAIIVRVRCGPWLRRVAGTNVGATQDRSRACDVPPGQVKGPTEDGAGWLLVDDIAASGSTAEAARRMLPAGALRHALRRAGRPTVRRHLRPRGRSAPPRSGDSHSWIVQLTAVTGIGLGLWRGLAIYVR